MCLAVDVSDPDANRMLTVATAAKGLVDRVSCKLWCDVVKVLQLLEGAPSNCNATTEAP